MKHFIQTLIYALLAGGILWAVLTAEVASTDAHNDAKQPHSEVYGVYVTANTYRATNGTIQRLIECESGGLITALNPDDVGSPSFGILQWKQASFHHYNNIYGIVPGLEYAEVLNIIYDPDIQVALATRVIADGGIGNWYNCAVKQGLL